MTKAEISEKIQFVAGLPKKESSKMLEAVFAIMKDTLESGETLKISGFGNFNVKNKTNRRGRNPQTGDFITISQRRIVTFKPSVVLRDAINK